MKRVFGTKSATAKAPAVTIEDANSNMETRGNTLDAKIDKLDQQLVKLREQISRTRPGPAQEATKRRALQILKQKRLYESQREQLYSQQFNLDQVAFTTESVKETVTTVQALKAAKKDLTKAMKAKEFNIDKIDKLQDEMMDLMDRQKEIQESLGQSYDVPDVDEDELMDELNALDYELATETTAADKEGVPSYLQETPEPALPAAPTIGGNQPVAVQEETEAVDVYGLPPAPAATAQRH